MTKLILILLLLSGCSKAEVQQPGWIYCGGSESGVIKYYVNVPECCPVVGGCQVHMVATICNGDMDNDGDVDLRDMALMIPLMTGP